MQIGEVAKQSGFSKDTLRYYEKIGLIQLDKKQRGENNYRIYDNATLQKLSFIRKLKSFNFTLQEIKDLLRMEELDLISCEQVSQVVNAKLAKIEKQISDLQKSRSQLLYLKNKCKGNCMETINHQV